MPYQPVQFGFGLATNGFLTTAGSSGTRSFGEYVFVAGNNATLSQSVQNQSATITINFTTAGGGGGGPAIVAGAYWDGSNQVSGTRGLDFTALDPGNTTNIVTGSISKQLVYVGGSNITLSQSLNGGSATITINAGATNYFTLQLSNNVAGGAATDLYATRYVSLVSGFSVTDNDVFADGVRYVKFVTSTVGQDFERIVFAATGDMTLSQSINGNSATLRISRPTPPTIMTIGGVSATAETNRLCIEPGEGVMIRHSVNNNSGTMSFYAAPGKPWSPYFNNAIFANGQSDIFDNGFGVNNHTGSVMIWPLNFQGRFNPALAAGTMALVMSHNNGAAFSANQTWSFDVGFYTLTGSSLTLVNSARSTFSQSSQPGNSVTQFYGGKRFLTFDASLFSSEFFLTGNQYWVGFRLDSTVSPANFLSVALVGAAGGMSAARSGYLGSASATTQGWHFMHGNLVTGALPSSLADSQLVKGNLFIPEMHFWMRQSQ